MMQAFKTACAKEKEKKGGRLLIEAVSLSDLQVLSDVHKMGIDVYSLANAKV